MPNYGTGEVQVCSEKGIINRIPFNKSQARPVVRDANGHESYNEEGARAKALEYKMAWEGSHQFHDKKLFIVVV